MRHAQPEGSRPIFRFDPWGCPKVPVSITGCIEALWEYSEKIHRENVMPNEPMSQGVSQQMSQQCHTWDVADEMSQ